MSIDPEKLAERIWTVTVTEVATAFAVSVETVNKWVRKGKFPRPIRLQENGLLRFRIADVDAFLSKRQRQRLRRSPRGFLQKRTAEK